MKTIHYAIGLPRSGSTLLMNILQQNPEIFTSSTCPMPYMVDGCSQAASSVSEFIAMDQDVLNKSLTNFVKQGIDGWFSAMSDKPIAISKSRSWDTHLNFLFHAYENPKFIVCLRDLRDIICSFEKLLHKNTFWNIGSREDPFHMHPFEKRMEIYCTDVGANLGRPLHHMPHVFEWMQKRPNNFFLFRFEDFNQDPARSLNTIYDWMQMPRFQHDLNNVEQAKQYEHDTVYRALVTHKTERQVRKLEPSWPKMMTKDQSNLVIKHNEWFYQTFYPEIYHDHISNRF
jgi:sulfotransferase